MFRAVIVVRCLLVRFLRVLLYSAGRLVVVLSVICMWRSTSARRGGPVVPVTKTYRY